MRITRQHIKLANCVSRDDTREVLQHVAIVRKSEKEGYAEATDGRMFCRVPVEFDPGDEWPKIDTEPVLLTPEMLDLARRHCGRGDDISFTIGEDGSITTARGWRIPGVDANKFNGMVRTWPKTSILIPDMTKKENLCVASFNAKMLATIAEIMGDQVGGVTIIMDDKNNTEPMLVCGKTNKEIGIIMPMRTQGVPVYGQETWIQPSYDRVVPNPYYLGSGAGRKMP